MVTTMTDHLTDQLPTDPDDDAYAAVPGPPAASPLAALAADVQRIVATPELIRHPSLPDYVMEFRTDLDTNELAKWDAIASKGRGKSGADRRLVFALTIAGTNTRILHNGEVVTNSDGRPVTFRDKELQETLGVTTGAAAAGRFIGSDGPMASIANRILEASGYGEEAESVDPTEIGSPQG